MGFTTNNYDETLAKMQKNKKSDDNIYVSKDKESFYSFLEKLNLRTEMGME